MDLVPISTLRPLYRLSKPPNLITDPIDVAGEVHTNELPIGLPITDSLWPGQVVKIYR